MSSPVETAATQESVPAIFRQIDPRLLARFKAFHERNPWVYREFRALAQRMKTGGSRRRYSAWVIVNVIRWHRDLSSRGDPFKVNNDFIAIYARLLIYRDPSFEGFFELRAMKSSGRKLSGEERDRRSEASGA